jgi:hypothetical protein
LRIQSPDETIPTYVMTTQLARKIYSLRSLYPTFQADTASYSSHLPHLLLSSAMYSTSDKQCALADILDYLCLAT